MEGGIHHRHECSRRALESKGHHQPLKETVACGEGGLGHVLVGDSNLKIPTCKIQLREVPGSLQLVQQLVYEGQWVTVPHCKVIQSAKVHAEPEFSSGFLDKNYGSCKR